MSIGKIHVYTGPMRSGKTESLIGRMNTTLKHNYRSVLCFVPDIAGELYDDISTSHDKNEIECVRIPLHNPEYILGLVAGKRETIFIDEVECFGEGSSLVDVVLELSLRGHDVYCAGLSTNKYLSPYPIVGELLCIADYIHKCKAICEKCGNTNATVTILKPGVNDDPNDEKNKDNYLVLCRECANNQSEE